MCIICNCPPGDPAPEHFLAEFESARQAMKRAEAAMLEVAQAATTKQHATRYGAVHKQMVRLRRDWNRLEQVRERGALGEG